MGRRERLRTGTGQGQDRDRTGTGQGQDRDRTGTGTGIGTDTPRGFIPVGHPNHLVTLDQIWYSHFRTEKESPAPYLLWILTLPRLKDQLRCCVNRQPSLCFVHWRPDRI